MKNEKIGLIIFLISAIFMIVLGWLGSWWITAALRDLTLAQIDQTSGRQTVLYSCYGPYLSP